MDSTNLSAGVSEDSQTVDVVVIGGGISGLGAALEAQRRGYSVILLERGARVAAGTSANSLRIMHGGFRYLQSLAFDRVFTSMSAQGQLVRKYPTLLKPLPCVMPLSRWGLRSYYPVSAAVLLFRVFARGLKWPPPAYLPVVHTASDASAGDSCNAAYQKLWGRGPVLQWWDWQLTSHHALAAALQREFETLGGVLHLNSVAYEVLSYRSVVGIKVARLSKSNAQIAVGGHRQEAGQEAGQELELRAQAVIDCRGSGVRSGRVESWATAFNLVLSKPIDTQCGVALSTEGRLLFAVPRDADTTVPEARGAVGTWYVADADPTAEEPPNVSEEQISAAIADVNRALPGAGLMRAQVIGVEAGVLPCVSAPQSGPVKLLSRERIESRGRVITVLSTKYTTFETQARWAVNALDEVLGR